MATLFTISRPGGGDNALLNYGADSGVLSDANVPDGSQVFLQLEGEAIDSSAFNTGIIAGSDGESHPPDEWASEGQNVVLLAADADGVDRVISAAIPWPAVDGGGGGTSFPTDWAYANYALPVPSGAAVAGFTVDGGDNNLLKIVAHWTRFEGAGHYQLQARHVDSPVFFDVATPSQVEATEQDYTINPWQDDGRFTPGQNYVWRIRATE